MKQRFWQKARELIRNTPEDIQTTPKIGLEVEMGVFDNNGKPTIYDQFGKLDFVDTELGATQIEILTDPIKLKKIKDLEDALIERQKLVSSSTNLAIVRIGAIPNINIQDIEVAPKEKYKIVPKFHDERRGPHINTVIGGVDFNKANCMGLFCSTQFNIQADSLEDAVDKTNRSFMISPFLVACSGNARIVASQDTKIEDIRMLAWHASHDIRTANEVDQNKETRIGTPNTYLTSIEDYFNRCSQHPFFLKDPEAALQIGIGTFWLDTRIKFINGKPIVEYRAMSCQPSAKEDVAMTAFYIGRLAYSQITKEPLMDMAYVQANRQWAMQNGLKRKLISENRILPATIAVENELRKAESGLEMLGYNAKEITEYTKIIRDRIALEQTPATKFAEECKEKTIEEAIVKYQI